MARHYIADFVQATTSDLVRGILNQALVAAEEDDCYRALKLIRRIIQHEDAVLGKTPNMPIPTGNSDHHAKPQPSYTGV
jgi:flagellar protein FlbT